MYFVVASARDFHIVAFRLSALHIMRISEINSEQIANISRSIGQYLSGSLVSILLRDMYGDHLLSTASRACPKVTSVTI